MCQVAPAKINQKGVPGFDLWTTLEWVGTPALNPQVVCFVNAKSTRARTGIVVHMTAPTSNAGWDGNITLEIANFGPFHLVLKPGDAVAQLTVATISSAPDLEPKVGESKTARQTTPAGTPDKEPRKSSTRKTGNPLSAFRN